MPLWYPLSVNILNSVPVLDVGVSGQRRAGRVSVPTDFTDLGQSVPAGLWNLGDVSDVSGNTRNLTNKGAVTFGKGILGATTEAAIFTGAAGQALYIPDTGAGDPFRIKTGSFGCWFRTARRGTSGALITKYDPTAGNRGFQLIIDGGSNAINPAISYDGTNAYGVVGVTDVCDDRWHHTVATYDGSVLRLYVDFALEATVAGAGTIFGSTSAFQIGNRNASAGTNGDVPHWGRIDEAFITPDILSEDQIRVLGSQKIAHGFSTTPRQVRVNVRRRVRGPVLAVGDFTATPQFLLNGDVYSTTTFASLGSLAPTMTNSGGSVLQVAGPDGKVNGAFSFGAAGYVLTASDTGLPTGTASRTMGIWFRTVFTGTQTLMIYGTDAGPFSLIGVDVGAVRFNDGTTATLSPGTTYNDGAWHFLVAAIDNAAADGLKMKLYADAKLVAGATSLASIASLGGAAGLRLGQRSGGTPQQFLGGMARGFITNYTMAQDEISNLFAKGSLAFGASPKNPGDHVEMIDATNVYCLFDTLDSQHQIDLGVSI